MEQMSVIKLLFFALVHAVVDSIELEVEHDELDFAHFCKNGSSTEIHLHKANARSTGILKMMSPVLPGMNCSVTLKPPKNIYIFLTFSEIHVNTPVHTMYVLSKNVTTTLDNDMSCPSENCPHGKFFSNSTFPEIELGIFSTIDELNPVKNTSFKAIFTLYQTGKCHPKKHFECKNGLCIWKDLACDGHNHCGYSISLLNCTNKSGNTWAAITIAFGAISFVILVPLFCFLAIFGGKKSRTTTVIPHNPTILVPSVNDDERTALLPSNRSLPDLSAAGPSTSNTGYSSIHGSDTLYT